MGNVNDDGDGDGGFECCSTLGERDRGTVWNKSGDDAVETGPDAEWDDDRSGSGSDRQGLRGEPADEGSVAVSTGIVLARLEGSREEESDDEGK